MTADHSNQRADLLLIDDEPDVRDVIVTAGKMLGLVVKSFGDSQTALSEFEGLNPKITIVDYALGNGDQPGTEVGRQIKALAGGQETTLILLSGDLTEQVATEAKSIGFDKLLRKPVSIPELMGLLKGS